MTSSRRRHLPVVALGGGVALAVAAAGAILFWPAADESVLQRAPDGRADTPVEERGTSPAITPEQAVAAALPRIACSWVGLSSSQSEAGGLGVVVRGAAGHPVRAQNQIEAAVARTGGKLTHVDFSGVAQINPGLCAPVQAFSQIRDGAAQRLSIRQEIWEKALQSEPAAGQGWIYARAVIDLNMGDPSKDFALFGLEGSSGLMETILESRADLERIEGAAVTRLPNDRLRLNMATGHTGWSGILLVTGQPPFDPQLIAPTAGSGPGWAQRFTERAAERGWRTEMLWYKVVDEQPDESRAPEGGDPAPSLSQ